MKINVHIERLILEGLPVTNSHGPQVKGAIEQELARLLKAHGLSHEIRTSVAVSQVRGGSIQLTNENETAKLGQGIAQAVHEGIGDSNKRQARKALFPRRRGILQ
jgi:hypothetical protein